MTMERPHAGPPRGILNPELARQKIVLTRQLPAAELRGVIEHYWIVRWDLRGEAAHTQETLPHPSVHWVTDVVRSYVIGVVTGRFTRALEGRGRALGVKFKPGGFYPFFSSLRHASIAELTDKEIAPSDAFGEDGARVASELLAMHARWMEEDDDRAEANDASNEEMMSLLDRFLVSRLSAPDADANANPRAKANASAKASGNVNVGANVDAVSAIVDRIMSDRDIIKVDDIAARFAINKRTLQRLFNQYVGVSPKWVIKRYRLHEAVERVAAGEAVNWSRLAADLGYFDQTHFIKDFKALIGKSPSEYARGASAAAANAGAASARGAQAAD